MTRSTLAASLLIACLAACSKSAGTPHLSAPESAGYTPAGPASDGGEFAPAEDASMPAPSARGDAVATAPMRGEGGAASVGGELRERERKSGLGTAYGEQRNSAVRMTRFERADPVSPDLVLSLRYNDSEGVRRIAQLKTGSPSLYPALQRGSEVTVTLRDESGAPLSAAQVGGDVYAIGEPGARYTIGIENHGAHRLEVVASVDGLDVLDGGEADFGKRGYVVAPYTSFAIDGWRTSDDTVAAFRFADTSQSYAAQTGRPRNVGVIGVAFFHEAGQDDHDLIRRDSADPFPNRYAPPPPAYRGY